VVLRRVSLALCAAFVAVLVIVTGMQFASAAPVTSQVAGTTLVTTSSTGYATVTHNLGSVPSAVTISFQYGATQAIVDTYTATTFRFRGFNTDGTVATNRAVMVAWIVTAGPAPTTPPTTPATITPTTPPTTATTTPPTTPPTTAPTTPPTNGDWPSEDNTGPVAGTTLTTYTGPLSITTPNTVIDSKTINGDLNIKTTGVVIKNSIVKGEVTNYENGATSSFTIQDSIVQNGAREACMCIGSHDFTALRVEVIGGNRGMYCVKNCKIQDSYVHKSALEGEQHGSAIRVEQGATLIHNKLACDWTELTNPEIGCSADMTGYPDFAPIKNNTIDNNYFVANPKGLGFCAYGGGTNGKPYSSDPTNATNIKFTNNVFEKGSNGKCGTWGAITDFISGRTGNVWNNNTWNDGSVVQPG
jgi:hypothetical protein